MKVFNPVYDEESNDYYFRITRGNGFIEDSNNENKYVLNSNFRIIRVLLSQPNYQLHSEDIFTEEEKDIFNNFVSNNWDKVIESSKNMYYILGESIPKEFPLLATDFSSLSVKD
jgi:tRNA A22 N-methylase